MAEYANIIVDISHEKLDKTFQYKIPEALKEVLKIGMQVEIPFGKGSRKTTGYVVELTDTPEYVVGKYSDRVSADSISRVDAQELWWNHESCAKNGTSGKTEDKRETAAVFASAFIRRRGKTATCSI